MSSVLTFEIFRKYSVSIASLFGWCFLVFLVLGMISLCVTDGITQRSMHSKLWTVIYWVFMVCLWGSFLISCGLLLFTIYVKYFEINAEFYGVNLEAGVLDYKIPFYDSKGNAVNFGASYTSIRDLLLHPNFHILNFLPYLLLMLIVVGIFLAVFINLLVRTINKISNKKISGKIILAAPILLSTCSTIALIIVTIIKKTMGA